MNIIINRIELLHAAQRMAAIAPSSSPLKILRGVLMETDAGTGKLALTATNLDISLAEKLPCTATEDDALIVNAHLLANMLEKLSSDTVKIARQENQPSVSLESGQAQYTVPIWAHTSFPKPDLPFPEDTVRVSGIPTMAKRTVFATTIDNEMPLLRCVNLIFTPNGLQATGSDGNCIVTAKGDEKSIGNITLLVPASSLEKLSRMVDDKDEFHMGTTGKNIMFFRENFQFSARIMEGSYINTEQLISMIRNSFTVLTDVPDLRNALNYVLSVGSGGKFSLAFEGSRITFHCESVDANASTSIEVIPLTGTPQGEYWYNARKFAACLHSLSGTVTLGVAQDGILTMTTPDAYYIQSAMRPSAAARTKKPPQAA